MQFYVICIQYSFRIGYVRTDKADHRNWSINKWCIHSTFNWKHKYLKQAYQNRRCWVWTIDIRLGYCLSILFCRRQLVLHKFIICIRIDKICSNNKLFRSLTMSFMLKVNCYDHLNHKTGKSYYLKFRIRHFLEQSHHLRLITVWRHLYPSISNAYLQRTLYSLTDIFSHITVHA